MDSFNGKTAVVIGGSGGIGLEISAMLWQKGAELVIQGRNQEKLDKAVEYITSGSRQKSGIRTIVYDFETENFCDIEKSVLNSAVANADILCICYGPFLQESLHRMTCDQWQNTAMLNYALPGFFVSSALEKMMEKKWGRILLFGGTGTSFRSEFKTNAAYAGAKTGLGVIVQSAAACYSNYGITCNAILPGFTETEYVDCELGKQLAEKMPGGTMIDRKSIAKAAEFLLSNGDLNGVLLKMDRGWSPVSSL